MFESIIVPLGSPTSKIAFYGCMHRFTIMFKLTSYRMLQNLPGMMEM